MVNRSLAMIVIQRTLRPQDMPSNIILCRMGWIRKAKIVANMAVWKLSYKRKGIVYSKVILAILIDNFHQAFRCKIVGMKRKI